MSTSSTFITLSYVLKSGLSCYNNHFNIKIRPYKAQEKEIILSGHVGTHIDVPFHVSEHGKKITDYSISDFVYSRVCVVYVHPQGHYITPVDLSCIPADTELLIICTGAYKYRYEDRYALENTGINPECVDFLRKQCPMLRAVGIDSISVNAYQNKEPGRLTHKAMLDSEREILIIEDMDLSELHHRKIIKVIVAPLVVDGCDGAPCTIIAEVENHAI